MKHQRGRGKPRPSSAQQGYGSAWRAVRDAFIQANLICVCPSFRGCRHAPGRCGARSTDADHLEEAPEGGKPADDSRLQALCHSCHWRKTLERKVNAKALVNGGGEAPRR